MIALQIPLWGKAVAALAVVALLSIGYAAWRHSIYQEGYDDAIEAVSQQNRDALEQIHKRRSLARDCDAAPGMRWNQVTRKCEPGA